MFRLIFISFFAAYLSLSSSEKTCKQFTNGVVSGAYMLQYFKKYVIVDGAHHQLANNFSGFEERNGEFQTDFNQQIARSGFGSNIQGVFSLSLFHDSQFLRITYLCQWSVCKGELADDPSIKSTISLPGLRAVVQPWLYIDKGDLSIDRRPQGKRVLVMQYDGTFHDYWFKLVNFSRRDKVLDIKATKKIKSKTAKTWEDLIKVKESNAHPLGMQFAGAIDFEHYGTSGLVLFANKADVGYNCFMKSSKQKNCEWTKNLDSPLFKCDTNSEVVTFFFDPYHPLFRRSAGADNATLPVDAENWLKRHMTLVAILSLLSLCSLLTCIGLLVFFCCLGGAAAAKAAADKKKSTEHPVSPPAGGTTTTGPEVPVGPEPVPK